MAEKADKILLKSTPVLYPDNIESKIGMDKVRAALMRFCNSEPGQNHVAEMSFSTNFQQVLRQLEEVREMIAARSLETPFALGTMEDARPWLKTLRAQGSHVDAQNLAALRSTLDTGMKAYDFFARQHNILQGEDSGKFPRLWKIVGEMADMHAVIQAISIVVNEHGEVRDNASAELADIRRELAGISSRISTAMRRVMTAGIRDGYLPADVTPTMRDGRLVLPVAPMNKRSLSGIVHDESATGRTVFIEPAAVVELNNRQRELEMREKREIIRILITLANQLRPEINNMLQVVEILAYLDFVGAKASYAVATDAHFPHLEQHPQLEWYTARHPVLQATLEKQGRRIVPLDIHLSKEKRILVISGPNAGGKSVTLKTAGIIQYMTQCGVLPTLYENSHMGIFDSIFVDIGDDQSLEDDLSTYSSHLRNMKAFLSRGGYASLILIDEFGSGTEPLIGGAIAQALLERFNKMNMWGIVTTHYQNLKTFAEDTPGLVNGSMLYDRQKMQPLFRLAVGHPGSSFAIEIARKIGLPGDLLAQAGEIVGSDYVNMDKYLLDIARDRRYWENKRDRVRQREKHLESVIERYETDAEQLRQERKQILKEARTEASRILEGSNAAIERTIHEIRKSQAQREATLEARRRLREQKESLHSDNEKDVDNSAPDVLRKAPKPSRKKTVEKQPQALQPISVGDYVLLDKGGQPGQVVEVKGNKATVVFGLLKTTVELSRLERTMRKPKTSGIADSFISKETTEAIRQRQLDFSNEIDLRGMRADEALQAVAYFIDDALQFNAGRVRILHGTGTGALRTAIREYLSTVQQVKSYHDEDVRFGGAGITVVNL